MVQVFLFVFLLVANSSMLDAQQISPGVPDADAVAAAMDASKAQVQELFFAEHPDGELVVEVDLPRYGVATLSLIPTAFVVIALRYWSMMEHNCFPIPHRQSAPVREPFWRSLVRTFVAVIRMGN